ncbi:MAG TPA: ferrous iron transport protein A [Ruminococcus sp.]|nr:ferrous iron transport protein A [Ruminococcus sp.]HCR73644.1 ferrous iron transport protein A [Ruminococcus sp.]
MKLTMGKAGGRYIVSDVSLRKDTENRLEALGLISGSYVEIISRKHSGTMIIRIRGTRFAIGKDIADGIIVEGDNADDRDKR